MPNQPVLYFLNDEISPKKIDTRVAYTKNQLQVISKDEKLPSRDMLTAKEKRKQAQTGEYVVEKIVSNKIQNGKMMFKTKWLGYPLSQATWESADNLKQGAKDILNDYLESIAN